MKIVFEFDDGTIERREVSADFAVRLALQFSPRLLQIVAEETASSRVPSKRRGGRKPKPDPFEEEEEKPKRGKYDREAIKRLIKDSDLSPKEIAEREGCNVMYVYMTKNQMKKAGELD
jgi:hypothetical protein